MGEIRIETVYKVGSRELRSGRVVIQFEVDQTAAAQLLPYHLLKQDQPLSLTITDGKPDHSFKGDQTNPQEQERNKLYAQIEILVKEAGLAKEEVKRDVFYSITGKRSKKDMTIEDLIELEKYLYKEANPIPQEA